MNNPILRNFSPALQLLYFFIFMFLFLFLGSAVAAVFGQMVFGLPMANISAIMENPTAEQVTALMWMNNLSQLFTFILPVIFFLIFFGKSSAHGLMLRSVDWKFVLGAMAFILLASGVVDLSSQLNHALIPAGSAIEAWAKPMEEAVEKLTLRMMEVEGLGAVIITFFSVALVPAVCEELAFRGVMQPLIAKSTRNVHLAIWGTAIAFSIFHMQFYGFIPRVIIGGLLGYLVIWTGSIWPSIAAHFINNAAAFAMYKIYGTMESPEGAVQSEWYAYVISIVITLGFVVWFIKNSKWPWLGFEYLGVTQKIASPLTNESGEPSSKNV